MVKLGQAHAFRKPYQPLIVLNTTLPDYETDGGNHYTPVLYAEDSYGKDLSDSYNVLFPNPIRRKKRVALLELFNGANVFVRSSRTKGACDGITIMGRSMTGTAVACNGDHACAGANLFMTNSLQCVSHRLPSSSYMFDTLSPAHACPASLDTDGGRSCVVSTCSGDVRLCQDWDGASGDCCPGSSKMPPSSFLAGNGDDGWHSLIPGRSLGYFNPAGLSVAFRF